MILFQNGRVSIGVDNDKYFAAHIEYMRDKYKSNVLMTKNLTRQEYENKKAKCTNKGVADYAQMFSA